LIVHFSGGTEVRIRTSAEPTTVYDQLSGDQAWLVVEDENGTRHYLAVARIAYLAFDQKKDIGFSRS